MSANNPFIADLQFRQQTFLHTYRIMRAIDSIQEETEREIRTEHNFISTKTSEAWKNQIAINMKQQILNKLDDLERMEDCTTRLAQYVTRQKADFHNWFKEVFFHIRREKSSTETCLDTALFPDITGALVFVKDFLNIDLIAKLTGNDINTGAALANYIAYLKTAEANSILRGESNPVTPEKYDIYNVEGIRALIGQIDFLFNEVYDFEMPGAKKQKMNKEKN